MPETPTNPPSQRSWTCNRSRTHAAIVMSAIAMIVVGVMVPHRAAAYPCYLLMGDRSRSCQIGSCAGKDTGPFIACKDVRCEDESGCPKPPDATSVPTVEYHPVQARLQIQIPNLEFSKLPEKITPGSPIISVPWIAQYIAAVFRWAVRVGAIVAVVMIMIGGVIWMTSGATGALSKAKEMMTNAVIGLILLVGSYTTLYLVNPDLVAFRSLLIEVVQPQFLESEEEPEEVEGVEPPSDPGSIVLVEGDNLKAFQSKGTGEFTKVPLYLLLPLQQAAKSLKEHDVELWVTSGFRTPELQYALIKQNCEVVNADGSSPKGTPCSPATCRMLGGAKSCPHTTGAAVDVWGAQGGGQCMRQKQCASATAIQRNGWDTSIDPCHTDTCQALVIDAMRDAGFCNWAGEAWHFEWGNGFSDPCQ